jgi:hypothetical protein
VQGAQDAERQVVVGGEDRGDLGHPGENLAGAVPRGGVPVRRHDRRDLRARLGQRPPPAGDAALAVEPVIGAGDVPDGLVADLEQVPGRGVRARLLVDGDQAGRPARVTVDGDQRDVIRDVVQRLVGRLDRGDDDQARHPLVAVPPDRVGDWLAVQRAHVLHADREAVLERGMGQRVQHRDGTVQGGGLGDHADHLRRARDQHAGGLVGPVAELGDGGLHPAAGLLADVRMVVQHAGDGLVRDPGQPGDVSHRWLAG